MLAFGRDAPDADT